MSKKKATKKDKTDERGVANDGPGNSAPASDSATMESDARPGNGKTSNEDTQSEPAATDDSTVSTEQTPLGPVCGHCRKELDTLQGAVTMRFEFPDKRTLQQPVDEIQMHSIPLSVCRECLILHYDGNPSLIFMKTFGVYTTNIMPQL